MIFQVVQLKYGYYSYTEETVHLKKNKFNKYNLFNVWTMTFSISLTHDTFNLLASSGGL